MHISNFIPMLFTHRTVTNWTDEKDLLLLKEMGGQGIFEYKAGSPEKGGVWQVIASNLNCRNDLFDVLTSRGVRDRFTLLARKYKAKMSKEIKNSGIRGEELAEFELLMEELIALSEESDRKAESETDTAKKNAPAHREKATEIRQQAMETMAQRKKLQAEAADEEVKDKKRRRSGFDTMSWLAKKTKRDAELKEKEMKDQREKKEKETKERNDMMVLLQKQLQVQIDNQQKQQQRQNMIKQQLEGDDAAAATTTNAANVWSCV